MTNEQLFAALGIVIVAVQGISVFYLARLNSRLQHKVNRLSVDLDQRVQRLHRAQSLLNAYVRHMAYLSVVKEDSITLEIVRDNLKHQGRAMSYEFELNALAHAIGEKRLIEAVDKLRHARYINVDDTDSPEDDLLSAALPCYRVIAELLVKATQVSDEQK